MKSNKLKLIIILMLSVVSVFLNAADSQTMTETSSIYLTSTTTDAGGKRIVARWSATMDILSRQPHWDGYSSNAPMSESYAVSIALAKVKMSHPDIHDFIVASIEIKNLSYYGGRFKNLTYCSNVWFYAITITPKDDDETIALTDAGKDCDEIQIVFMDGTVIKPDVLTMRLQ